MTHLRLYKILVLLTLYTCISYFLLSHACTHTRQCIAAQGNKGQIEDYIAIEDYMVTHTDTVVMVTTEVMSLFHYITGQIIL